MELPASHTQATARENSRRVLAGDRAEAKAQRPVERYGNVDHQLKKARVVGMQAQAKKIMINTIQTKIQMSWENADVYRRYTGCIIITRC